MALKILTVASEAYPLAKTGGLGDAVSGMAGALHAMGVDVTMMLPAYRGVIARLRRPHALGRLHGLPGGDARLIKGHCPDSGVGVLLLDNPALYDREGVYVDEFGAEYPDNGVRFAALSHAAARVAAGVCGVSKIDVLHAHDWHAALAPLALRQLGVRDVHTVLTLHNIAFQGSCDVAQAGQADLQPFESGAFQDGRLNFLHAGIVSADKITVVSKNYRREILTPEFGCGLDALLRSRQADLLAIPNGIDASLWNPATDPFLRGCHFDADDMRNKSLCKRKLQARFGLNPSANTTLLAMGSRLTGQKMADVAVRALPRVLEQHPDVQVCVVGCGEKHIESQLRAMSERYAGRCAVHIGYSEEVAHLLHAGADMLLHGSRFEPFGLTPLYAMRYGTVPIGSRVGGMVDTIHDPGRNASEDAMAAATGLLFQGEDEQSMYDAIERAIRLRANPTLWRCIQRNAMQKDFGWERAAPAYLQCYLALCPGNTEPDRRAAAATKPVAVGSPMKPVPQVHVAA
ncbi:MAG TPA: glycogen synthase GlgA [Pusillimonas sp.]|nr:glycogen synthase GlgA [Pusillimonas sp.]HUH86647.1 glycogen synthase GlgA [Pusillimonas sp.]